MAVRVRSRCPPRARVLGALAGAKSEELLTPLAHGAVQVSAEEAGYFVICPAPPGPPLSETVRVWSEAELLSQVLRPAVTALQLLQTRGVTHRAIRLENMFRAGPGQRVVLGQAWAAPPGSLQPALYEPPYSAMCLPCGRGEGSIADDVYALGVALVVLALGRVPLSGLDDAAIIRRKISLGSYAALVGDERLPAGIADLVRGMLAEDPEHRPSPSLLADPPAARARRLAARPPRRAKRPLDLGGIEAWDSRVLGYAMARHPEQARRVLSTGDLDGWLRRSVGDTALAARIEDLVRLRGGEIAEETAETAVLVSRVIALLDPLAPLCWRGVALWPDGLGPALASAQGDSDLTGKLAEIVSAEAIGSWGAVRPERSDAAMLRVDAKHFRTLLQTRAPASGIDRLCYALNPLLPCSSALLSKRWVARLADLLPALEELSASVDRRVARPVDASIAGFVAARVEQRMDGELAYLAGAGSGGAASQLRLLARLQARVHPAPLPGLAAWLAAQAEPLLASWRNRNRRAVMQERLQSLAVSGRLADMLALIDDAEGRSADAQEAQQARRALARIDTELKEMAAAAAARTEQARCLGQELAAGASLAALVAVLIAAALG